MVKHLKENKMKTRLVKKTFTAIDNNNNGPMNLHYVPVVVVDNSNSSFTFPMNLNCENSKLAQLTIQIGLTQKKQNPFFMDSICNKCVNCKEKIL